MQQLMTGQSSSVAVMGSACVEKRRKIAMTQPGLALVSGTAGISILFDLLADLTGSSPNRSDIPNVILNH